MAWGHTNSLPCTQICGWSQLVPSTGARLARQRDPQRPWPRAQTLTAAANDSPTAWAVGKCLAAIRAAELRRITTWGMVGSINHQGSPSAQTQLPVRKTSTRARKEEEKGRKGQPQSLRVWRCTGWGLSWSAAWKQVAKTKALALQSAWNF